MNSAQIAQAVIIEHAIQNQPYTQPPTFQGEVPTKIFMMEGDGDIGRGGEKDKDCLDAFLYTSNFDRHIMTVWLTLPSRDIQLNYKQLLELAQQCGWRE